MRNQAHSLMSLVMVAGVAAAGFIGACGGKVVVDASNPSGAGGAGGAGGSFQVTTSGPQPTGPVITGPIMTGPATTGPQTDVVVSVGPGAGGGGPISAVSVGPGSSSVSGGPGPGSSAVSVGPGPGPSSSSGGTSPCDDACNKSSMCGLDFCGQFNINCMNPLPGQVQCPLTCIANASCGDIQKLAQQNFATPLGFCILGCQGMGPGPGSSGVGPGSTGVGPGSTGSGPMPGGCQQCTIQQCGSAVFACNAKKGPGSCSEWLQCAQGCGTDSMCLFGCDSQFPKAEPQYDAVYQCLCDKCDASCPNEDACLHTGP